ncbi:hypothetical protein A6768_24005 [Sphingobium yanoikuyae]|uniref:Mlr4354 like protein n=2 Tax=Sphingobium yanoikuyae TaxID=13690 RepID=A0A291N826_SPHYA|nr:hypothetical protein A6768_24005 [Sphingobium yanoikuyae]
MSAAASTSTRFRNEAGLANDDGLRFARTMRRLPALLIPLVILASPAMARDSLGIFESWGAFRDPGAGQNGPRCYAIAMPAPRRAGDAPKGFAAVGTWPRQHVRGQVHFRLSRPRAANARVSLSVGDRRFALVAGQADAWAANPQDDAAIIAAMRSASSMSVQSTSAKGGAFADSYALRGAATAIDAAALGCARLR